MGEANDPKAPPQNLGNSKSNNEAPFKLEHVFEDVQQIFLPSRVGKANDSNVIISIDTNVLLLPYTIRKGGLEKFGDVLRKIKEEGRLFICDRVAREFIANRDRKLADILKMIGDVRSKINIGEVNIAPIVGWVSGAKDILKAADELEVAKKNYTKALGVVESEIESWSGDDPVMEIYRSVFDVYNIISHEMENDDLTKEWAFRCENKIPPGYKDSSKSDFGIGDLIIWKSILCLAKKQRKDMIFVTGEEKSDWFVRMNGRASYPRPEIVAEYRKHSGGKNIRLAEFHEVLKEMDAPADIISEFKGAEESANNAIRLDAESNFRPSGDVFIRDDFNTVKFFSLPYGGGVVVLRNEYLEFSFRVSEHSKNAVWVYQNERDKLYMPNEVSGAIVNLEKYPNIFGHVAIPMGMAACIVNQNGAAVAFRFLDCNVPVNGENYELTIVYTISQSASRLRIP